MIINKETGEVMEDNFAKVFISNMAHVFSLSTGEGKLLGAMIRDCKYGNKINLTAKRKKMYMKEFGSKSLNSISTLIRNLEKKGYIKREEEGSTYYIINPHFIMKGNDYQRANVLTWWENGKQEFIVVSDDQVEHLKNQVLENENE